MRFGLFTSMGGQTWSGVLDLWRHLEATRWDIACVTDHFMPNTKEREGTMLESWSTLAGLAALVPRLRIGTIVFPSTMVPMRRRGTRAASPASVLHDSSMVPSRSFVFGMKWSVTQAMSHLVASRCRQRSSTPDQVWPPILVNRPKRMSFSYSS